MDDTQSVASLIESTTSKIQQLQQAFTELESHRAITLNLKWKELEEHFHGLERSLKKRFVELVDQEKAYVSKASEAQEMLEKREAMVVAKEQSSLEWLQEKRDSALSAIGSALGKRQKPSIMPIASNSEHNVLCVERPNEEGTKLDSEYANLTQIVNVSSQPCSPLMKLCQEMDAKGLNEYISENRKNLASIREEIPTALRSSSSPLNLVLDSLKNFYRLEVPEACGKKDADLLGLRRTCLMLLETLGQLLAELDPVPKNLIISSDIKQEAKVIADEWKSRLNDLDIDASGGNSLEVHAFLQLLATFGIASEFNQDEICNLIPSVSRRRQTADLCRSLGLSHRMTDVIEVLSNSGRQIEAINLAYAFELTEQFAPVPLLKAYLKESRRTSQAKAGSTSPGAQGHDVVAMACPERFVVGLDISESAIKKACELTSTLPNKNCFTFLAEDFFAWRPDELFDLIFDYTFFCAIDPCMRSAWANKIRNILKPDGELITLMFPVGDFAGGPPYPVSVSDYETVLNPLGFQAVSVTDNELAIEPRKGREKLGRWRRKSTQSLM